MIGVKFHEANQFLLQFSFKECQLNFSSFYKLKIPNTSFISCNLEQVDFTETQAGKTIFEDCNLRDAIFEATNLEKTDFRTASNFNLNPLNSKLKGARFSRTAIEGVVSLFQIIIE